jgi:alanyl-tRNA synthetase
MVLKLLSYTTPMVFPYDLTALIASERGFTVDESGFTVAMEAAKESFTRCSFLKSRGLGCDVRQDE